MNRFEWLMTELVIPLLMIGAAALAILHAAGVI